MLGLTKRIMNLRIVLLPSLRMTSMPSVLVEFFGVPRQRAGVATSRIVAATVADALRLLRVQHAGLVDLLNADGKLSPHYLLSLDGVAFVHDLATPLADDAKLLLLSADAGG